MKKKILLFGLVSFGLVSFKPTQNDLPSKIYRDMVFNAIDNMDFKFKDIVKAQAILESGHFKSAVFRHNNNAFGIRLPKKRETTAIGSKMGYAVYDDICLSIEDRLLYEKRYLSKFTKEQYYNYLNRVYAKNNVYSKKLKDIQKRFASVK
jgi:hypothetical protein